MTSHVQNKQITECSWVLCLFTYPSLSPSFYVIKQASQTMKCRETPWKAAPHPIASSIRSWHHLWFSKIFPEEIVFSVEGLMLCLCAQIFLFPSVTITTSYIGLVSMCFETHYRIICWDELKKEFFLGAFLESQLCVLPVSGLALSALRDIQTQQSWGVSVCGSNSNNHFHKPRSHAVLNHAYFCWRLEILSVRHTFPGPLFVGGWHWLNFIYSALKIFIKQKLEDNWVWSNIQTFFYIWIMLNFSAWICIVTVAKMQLEISTSTLDEADSFGVCGGVATMQSSLPGSQVEQCCL